MNPLHLPPYQFVFWIRRQEQSQRFRRELAPMENRILFSFANGSGASIPWRLYPLTTNTGAK